MRIIDWFCGIGGFSLGFTRAGMRVVGACEIDPFARAVYQKHFNPGWFPDDITKVDPAGIPQVDLWCGGFPCQDISTAGNGAGINGPRSGLFFTMLRAICVVRPRWLVLENVSEILRRGMGEVLGALAESGYDSEWDCLPASAFGFPHQRDRTFIVAYAEGFRFLRHPAGHDDIKDHSENFADGCWGAWRPNDLTAAAVADWIENHSGLRESDGLSEILDRIHCLGNAIVPQIPEWIGRRIMEADRVAR